MDIKSNEFKAIETLWKTLDDSSIIRDVLFKGKYISNAIKFISERNQITIDEAKESFLQICDNIVNILIQNKQLYRASHVLKNAQINELHYLFDLHQKTDDEKKKSIIIEYLQKIKENFDDDLNELEAFHICYKMLQENFYTHMKYLETTNKNHNNYVVTVNSIEKLSFPTYMKQSLAWRKEVAVDIFFKSQTDTEILKIIPILNKSIFFGYLLQNRLTGLLRTWLNEQYCSMAGQTIRSTLNSPQNFDEALNFLFRKWTFEPFMMNQITRKEKEVIKNEFAKLGLFENREVKQIDRKLNRFFTTHTFHENYTTLKSDEITKFIVENELLEMLPNKFIDYDWIKNYLKESDEKQAMRNELKLLGSTKDLLTKETNLNDFVRILNATNEYLLIYNKNFKTDTKEMKFFNDIVKIKPQEFHKISDLNFFTKNLNTKLENEENLETIEEILEEFQSINIKYIFDEFQSEPHFDDPQISLAYGDKVKLNFINYVERGQGTFATFNFINEVTKNFNTLNRQMILGACEEVAKLAMENPENEKLVTHVMAFLESFTVDTRNLRCFLRLLKLRNENETKNFEDFLDENIKVGENLNESIKNIESLEVYWKTKKIFNPPRSYLNQFIKVNDWFHFLLFCQYLKFPLNEFIEICQKNFPNKNLGENLIRAIKYEAPEEAKRSLYFTKVNKIPETSEIFENGKFLDSNFDLFAILLKCNEKISRHEMKFEDFVKMFEKIDGEFTKNDLLYQAIKFDWPVIAVLAATTKLYRFKYCWLTWLILSTNYEVKKRYEDIEKMAKDVVLNTIKIGFIRTLEESAQIFYPSTPFNTLTTFLHETLSSNFTEMDSKLKVCIIQLNKNNYNMTAVKGRQNVIPFTIRCLISHLQHNIKFITNQEQYLECLHQSEISQFDDGQTDFQLMQRVCKLLQFTNVQVNYENFDENEISNICDQLIANNYFEAAIEVASMMGKSKSDFIFKWWLHMHKSEEQRQTSFDFEKYLKYVETYGLEMQTFVRFLRFITAEMTECLDKFNIMIFIFRQFPTDELEFQIHNLYIKLRASQIENIQPLTSDYFENVIKKEKFLIHECLYELKSIAKIDELLISQRNLENENEIKILDELICKLLDMNDIIEALRVHEMFGYAPEDLKLLAYMLSVCEGISSIYDITKQERQIISNYAQLSNRFNRFTLRPLRTSSCNESMDNSMISMDMSESAVFDEPTPYKENKETFQAIQGLVCKIKHGRSHGHRAVLIYRASLILNRSFSELIKIKDPIEFLELAAACESDQKLLVMNDIVEAMNLSNHSITQFIAKEITISIIRTRFLQFNKDTDLTTSTSSSSWNQVFDDIWGFSLSKDLHLILELCKGKTTLLGTYLLKFYELLSQPSLDIPFVHPDYQNLCDQLNRSLSPQVLSLSKQNKIKLELLIVAHDCFCQECSTEGIGEILRLAKKFVNDLPKESSNLIVKLLCGIGRYREMFYCFDILIKNEAFEALLGQFSERQSSGLKTALLSYLNEFHPNNIEYYKMAASRFQMYTELSKIWRTSALGKIDKILAENQIKIQKSARIFTTQIQNLEVPYLKCSRNLIGNFHDALSDMVHATEVLSTENKIELAIKYTNFCELIAVQIHLVKIAVENETKLCPSILQIEKNQKLSQFFANYELLVPQMIILNKNLENIKIDYAKVIFCRSLIVGDEMFLQEFIGRLELSDAVIENIIKLAQYETITKKQEKILHDLVLMIRDVGVKFRLASLLGLKGILQKLLNDEQSYYYLLDTKYGAIDIL